MKAGETGQGLGVLKWGDFDPQLWLIKPVAIAAFRSLCQASPLVSWFGLIESDTLQPDTKEELVM